MQKVIITITVDWEGENFRNLNELLELRRKIGNKIPITHFICPAYFTKNIKNSVSKIKSAYFDIDEIALHIHSFKSLTDLAGVEFRTTPDFFHRFTPEIEQLLEILPEKFRPKNTGRGIPLSAYNQEEIIKILNISKKLLTENLDIKDVLSFRAGGWMANDDVYKALQLTGFLYDSTPAPPEILSQNYSEYNEGTFLDQYGENHNEFTDYIIKLWGKDIQTEKFLENSLTKKYCPDNFISRYTQPYKLENITVMPNNSSMSDYISANTMRDVLEKGIAEIKSGSEKPFFLNTGFHQEGSINYKIPIFDFIKSISNEEMEFIEFKTLEQAAKIAENYFTL